MNTIFKSIFIIGCLLLPAQLHAAANTYHVTQNGNGARSGENLGNAWAVSDFNALSGTGYAGDTFYFSGTFTTRIEIINIEGSSGQPVILDGYQSGDCDPINSVCSSSALLLQGMEIGYNKTGPDYINVYDFRMTRTNSTSPGFSILGDVSEGDDEKHCDYITVKRNYVYETNGTLFYYYSGRYSIVENNKFTHFGQNSTDATQGVNLIEVDDFIFKNNIAGHDDSSYPSACTSAEMIELHGCHRVLIEGNDVYGAPNQSGIRPKEGFGGNTDIIIRYNKIHDNHSRTSGGEQQGYGINVSTDAASHNSDVYIYANYIFNNNRSAILLGPEVSNIHIWSNILSSDGQHGIAVSTWLGRPGPDNVHIYNNTIIRGGDRNEVGENARGGIVFTSGTNVNIKNNILWNNRPEGANSNYNQVYSGPALSSFDHNTFYHSLSTATYYYSGAVLSLESKQEIYSIEDDYSSAGEIADSGFIDPAGPDHTYGTADDDYTIDGTYKNNGADLSQCFDVSVQSKNYHICYNDALDPDTTNWNRMSTTLPTVRTTKQEDHGSWERGAYVYKEILNSKMSLPPGMSPPSPIWVVK